MVALVTGQRGFLGRHVAERLAADGFEVAGAGRPEFEIPSPRFDQLLQEIRPELVVHCAGPASVPASVSDPESDRRGSVDVTRALVERLDGARLLLVSSAAVYGEPASLPVAEDAPLAPVSPYGRHRAECERLALEAGVEVTIARVFSAYGEGLKRQLLWDVCRQVLNTGEVNLAGTGEETRDFVHARDVAGALTTLARRPAWNGAVYNVASGEETTVADVARLVVEALGLDVPIRFSGERRPGDPVHWRADVSRLRSHGWSPTIPLEQGIHSYSDWVRGRP